ncbi:hypothetical protein TNCV_4696801 [Trichonephila clavipes]|nr:hypothetical protein TNCV_4696801 [Trichonephila clavipes]
MIAWTGIVREKKGVVSYDGLLTIKGIKYSTFQETVSLSKSEDFIDGVLDDAALVMHLIEEKSQERILRKKEQINGTT